MTGQLDKLTYPSSRQVQHGYDAADRLTSVSSGLVSVSIPKYHPQGTPEEMLYANGVKEVWTLTKRLQVGSIAVTKGGASLLTLGYGTGGENNGNVRTQSIQAGGHTFAQSYNYDALNRLETASETTTVPSSSNWSIGFQYDQYGNMAANGWTISVPAAMATSLAQYDPATNRRSRTAGGATISPNPYDKGGNLTSDPALGTMQYDQAGRLRQTQVLGKTITYDYDAEGRRVRRDYPGLGTTYYVYDGAGQLAAEYGASEPMSCTRCYLTADTLGSTRLMTDELGGVKQRTDYLPFGDLITASPTQGGGRQVITDGAAQTTFALAGGPTQKFTGKERDAETGLDYFGARYLSAAQGRFTSPDAPFADQHVGLPQSWNLFTYVRNSPLSHVDLDGFEVRKAELAAAQKQIGAMSNTGGGTYTIAFMGITTDGKNYLQGKNPTAVPSYSNTLGLGELNSSNTAILSNSNGYINAMAGHSDIDQIDTANAIYTEAKGAGLKVDVLTHSNGIEAAGAFAPGKQLNTSVVVAPNTRSAQTMQNVVNASNRTSILVSPRDFALNIPGAANKSPSFWSKLFRGNKNVTVTQTNQRGHRLQPYRQELESGGSAQDITQKQ